MRQYEPRAYRRIVSPAGLKRFSVCIAESDLAIWASEDLRAEAAAALRQVRAELEAYIARHREFSSSLQPLTPLPGAPEIVVKMCQAAAAAGVGPMAAVAGAIAHHVADHLAERAQEVIVENGGDIFCITAAERIVGIFAPGAPMSGRVGLRIPAGARLAVCTSSGRHGHSLSLGQADAAVVVACDGALADATATALGNRVHGVNDLESAVEWAIGVDGVAHVVVLFGRHMATAGELELVPLNSHEAT